MAPTSTTPVAQAATMMTNRSTNALCSRTAVDAARPSRPRRARVEATHPPRALLSRWLRPARSPPAATRPPNAGPNSCCENERSYDRIVRSCRRVNRCGTVFSREAGLTFRLARSSVHTTPHTLDRTGRAKRDTCHYARAREIMFRIRIRYADVGAVMASRV